MLYEWEAGTHRPRAYYVLFVLASAVTVQQSGTDRAEHAGFKHLKGREHLVEVYRIRWVDTSTEQRSGETAHAE
jgi:hypothetical protein